MPTLQKKRFNAYTIEYSITNPLGKDLARIEFFSGSKKVGRALLGDAIAPGSYASLDANGQINLYFPMAHLPNMLTVMELPVRRYLFVEHDNAGDAFPSRGGVMTDKRRRG